MGPCLDAGKPISIQLLHLPLEGKVSAKRTDEVGDRPAASLSHDTLISIFFCSSSSTVISLSFSIAFSRSLNRLKPSAFSEKLG